MAGYTVGTLHPSAMRRQWHALTEGEAADLADAVVHALAVELRRLNVAGADRALSRTIDAPGARPVVGQPMGCLPWR